MHVRPYAPRDRAAVRAICDETCDDAAMRAELEATLLQYADYYVDYEAPHCFVLADDADAVCGYILCAPDARKYIRKQKAFVLPRLRQLSPRLAREKQFSFAWERLIGLRYPAHMHIDLTARAQGHGYGRLLVQALLAHLREMGVKGVNLGCFLGHANAVKFYDRLGFRRLLTTRTSAVYGMRL